ncbi:hypothetical protein [Marininema halotolerans]|nr:hypothetical protein [Marininema halotolerans]
MIWRVLNNEKGLALPIVLAVSILLFFIITAVLTQLVRAGHGSAAEWKMIRAQYAAESGIARMQYQLCGGSRSKNDSLITQMNGFQSQTWSEAHHGNQIQIVSVAKGQGVKQTIRVLVAKDTCIIQKWSR